MTGIQIPSVMRTFKPDVAAELLTSCFKKHHGLFVPEERTELNIPKKGFVLRYSLK